MLIFRGVILFAKWPFFWLPYPGSLIRGTLRVSSSKTSMAFVRPDGAKSQDREWVVRGSNYRNRAVHGDVVIIQPILYGRTEERGFAKMVWGFFVYEEYLLWKFEWKTDKSSERHNRYYHIYWMMFWRKAIPKFLANQTPKSQQGPLLFNSLFVEAPGNCCYQIMVPAQWAPTGYKWGYNQVINPIYPF